MIIPLINDLFVLLFSLPVDTYTGFYVLFVLSTLSLLVMETYLSVVVMCFDNSIHIEVLLLGFFIFV